MDNTIIGIFMSAIIMIGIFLFRQASNTNKILLDVHTRLGVIEGALFRELKLRIKENEGEK